MEGKAIIISAPSGAGKTTIVRHLMEKFPMLKFSVSATTRPPRDYEKNGQDYHFMSYKDFQEKIEEGQILEWQEVYKGRYYGTLKSEIERIWKDGNVVVFDVEVLGGQILKSKFNESALSIFIKVSDVEVLRERLLNRKTETKETLDQRVERAMMEMEKENDFDAVVVNHNLKDALADAEKVIHEFLN